MLNNLQRLSFNLHFEDTLEQLWTRHVSLLPFNFPISMIQAEQLALASASYRDFPAVTPKMNDIALCRHLPSKQRVCADMKTMVHMLQMLIKKVGTGRTPLVMALQYSSDHILVLWKPFPKPAASSQLVWTSQSSRNRIAYLEHIIHLHMG